MATANVNGVRVFYEISGVGESRWSSCMGLGGRTTRGTLSPRDWPSHSGLSRTTGEVIAKVSVDLVKAASIASGDHAGAAEQFVDTLAFGPGSWSRFPPALQQTFITNAPTYLDEARDPEQLAFDLASIRTFPHRSLLTIGDRSPPTFAPVVAMLADALPNATVHTFPGAGHGPHNSHPDAYVEAVVSFIRGRPRCK